MLFIYASGRYGEWSHCRLQLSTSLEAERFIVVNNKTRCIVYKKAPSINNTKVEFEQLKSGINKGVSHDCFKI